MAKEHNEFVKRLEEYGSLPAMINLVASVGKDRAQEVLDEVNYYPDPKEWAAAVKTGKAHREVQGKLNSFFNELNI